MRDEMKRGRSQVLWRYTPGALFRYNESGGWSVSSEIMLKSEEPLTGALATAVQATLSRWNAIGPTGYPDPVTQPGKYAVGEPLYVRYEAWPTVFSCRLCGKVQYYKDVSSLKAVNDRMACIKCKSSNQLKQIPFAYVHECGRLDTLFVPKCRVDAQHSIELVNKGGFQESFWRCQVCRIPVAGNARAGLGIRNCECGKKKLKRGVTLEDTRAYYPQTVALVDVQSDLLVDWRKHSHFKDLLLAAVLRTKSYKDGDLTTLFAYRPGATKLSPELEATRDVLVQHGMPLSEAEGIVRKGAKAGGGDRWTSYETSLAPYRNSTINGDWSDARRTIEYVFVRDEPSIGAISLEQLAREAKQVGDIDSAERYERESQLGKALGIERMSVLQTLPILLGAIGFSRYFPSPNEAADSGANASPVALRPFPHNSNKIPIYVARNTTEAMLYELDPWRLGAFLEANCDSIIPVSATISEPAMRAWLLERNGPVIESGESHLVLDSWEVEEGVIVDEPSALMFGVLHTISHILKVTAHRYVGIDADSLAEYLFPAHGAGLLYVSAMVEFTLGGIDSVFRSNLEQWLGSARDFAGRCSFDPVCSQDGGACHACLYPKFGCAHYNRSVSRSFLFGGAVKGLSRPLEGYWMPSIGKAAERLKVRGAQ
jgi:hypothetical protein